MHLKCFILLRNQLFKTFWNGKLLIKPFSVVIGGYLIAKIEHLLERTLEQKDCTTICSLYKKSDNLFLFVNYNSCY